jgi:hypothetical protein
VITYLLGAFLIGWGLCVFGYELLYPASVVRDAEAANNALIVYAPNMFCAVIICWGAILISAASHRYRGGIWTYLGAVLIGLSMILIALSADFYLTGIVHSRRNGGAEILIICLAVAIFIFLLGCYSLVAGHIRHSRIQRESPPNKSRGCVKTPARRE